MKCEQCGTKKSLFERDCVSCGTDDICLMALSYEYESELDDPIELTQQRSSGLSTGAMVGIGVGVAVLLCCCCLIVAGAAFFMIEESGTAMPWDSSVTGGASFVVTNDGSEDICYVYLSDPAQENWDDGVDLLGMFQTIPTGSTVTVNIPVNENEVDIGFLDCDFVELDALYGVVITEQGLSHTVR